MTFANVIENSFSTTATLVPAGAAEEGASALVLDDADGLVLVLVAVVLFVLPPQAPSRRAARAAVRPPAPTVRDEWAIGKPPLCVVSLSNELGSCGVQMRCDDL